MNKVKIFIWIDKKDWRNQLREIVIDEAGIFYEFVKIQTDRDKKLLVIDVWIPVGHQMTGYEIEKRIDNRLYKVGVNVIKSLVWEE
jgi:hypothetical protein